MPPRIQLFSRLKISNQITSSPPIDLPFRPASTVAQKKQRRQDPYAKAQARARRAANISKQAALTELRSKTLGDPVNGIITPFVESFANASPSTTPASRFSPNIPASSTDGAELLSQPRPEPEFLNHFLNPNLLRKSLSRSQELSRPVADPSSAHVSDPAELDARVADHAKAHDIASAALERILALNNTSGKDRFHLNVQRCVEAFGRHRTDKYLAPRPSSKPTGAQTFEEDTALRKAAVEKNIAESLGDNPQSTGNIAVKTPRAGPDTGSSEVQIAVLTVKIQALRQFLETRGRKDKMNKRNLRLLVHRRQKLLQYLRKKERGGERWQHVTEALGLSEGTWKGEITL